MSREHLLIAILLIIGIAVQTTDVYGDSRNLSDPFSSEIILAPTDTIPLNDREDDYINDPVNNPFDLQDPAIIDQSVEFDPVSGQYIITEKMGDEFFRPPTYMTFEEYLDYRTKKQEDDYFKELAGVGSGQRGISGRIDPIADLDIKDNLVDRLFGGTEVDIRPQGSIDLTFGVDYSNTEDPGRTARQQRTGGFDFDMDIQMDVEGSIGEKLKLSTNYNTQATFDFDNVMKLDYGTDAFGEDDIIKRIEAGNVSLPLRGTLIQGSQSLFGLKTELQFGRLRVTGIASQQKSERERITLENGGQTQEFEVFADEYDENRHFFLTHYNRETFEEALEPLPRINTLFKIQRIQVWVKPFGREVEDIREVVALADLGEPVRVGNDNPDLQPPNIPVFTDRSGRALPDNAANPLYDELLSSSVYRSANLVTSRLDRDFDLKQGTDFERVQARMLSPSEFEYHPELGFISMNVNIPPDQVVGVSFEYKYQDQIRKVGELAQDVGSVGDTASVTQNVIFVKMLKSTVQSLNEPAWDLMMKNVYSIGGYQLSEDDFRLDIYYDDPGFGRKRFLPISNLAGKSLLEIFNMDKLNTRLDPQPDGIFDFVPGVTILPRTGKIIFPKLEPFGDALRSQITDPALADLLTFDTLYGGTVTDAREFAEQNRFTIAGSFKSSISSDISLGAFNIPPGSVRVTAGGRPLVEGVDYEIDYTLGRIRVLNEAILNSGTKINVDFEDNALFGFQTKTMLGVRADFEASKNLTIGATWMQLFERPFTQKVNIGDDPINNKMYGLDMTYSNEAPWLTKLVDKLPFYSTKETSSINFTAETAYMRPGHSKAINESQDAPGQDDKGGVTYIDDFEGTTSSISLNTPVKGPGGWVLASVPKNEMFPEADLTNDLRIGTNRALLNWMRIEPGLQGDTSDNRNPYVVNIEQTEVFPEFTPVNTTISQLFTFDLEYNPRERGPYNYDVPGGTTYSAGLTPNGQLNNPESRWGGVMRALTTNDFQASNIEFVEFWMLNPYLDPSGISTVNPVANQPGKPMDGYIYFEMGNISEDVLKDSWKFFENGLPGPNNQGRRFTETEWGRVPLTPQITTAFDIDADNRTAQDVGLDGMADVVEREHFADYLSAINAGVTDQAARDEINNDPSNDNYRTFRSQGGWPDGTPVLERYSRFFGLEGNSPVQEGGNNLPTSSSTLPDSEDIDRDRTLSENESYFQYRVPIRFDGQGGIDIEANPYITDEIISDDGRRNWYRFKVPLRRSIDDPDYKEVGGIQNFRSIRFMRMYFKDFAAKMNFRFARLDLVRNQWRRYLRDDLRDLGCVQLGQEESNSILDINSVSIEENSRKFPFNYVTPPGINREQALGVNINALQNERSISLEVCNLEDGKARGIYKLTDLDLRTYKRMKMFIHAEDNDNCDAAPLDDGDLSVIIRLGSDFTRNYYEYEIPLSVTKPDPNFINAGSDGYQRFIWPEANDVDIDLRELIELKKERNSSAVSLSDVYPAPGNVFTPENGRGSYRIKGNPNLGQVKVILIGLKNPCAYQSGDSEDIDNLGKSAEVWVNELRVFGLDERGGVAGTARLDLQMADLGTATISGLVSSIGFGQIEQQVQERQREQLIQYDISTDINVDKFFPDKWGLSIPFYFQYSKEISTPEFDPYDLDVKLEEKKDLFDSKAERDSIQDLARTVTTIKSFNFTNVKKERTNTEKKPMPWDVSNFSFTYAWEETEINDPFVESDKLTRQTGAIDYRFSRQVKYIEPFKGIKNDKLLGVIKNINFNPLPNSFTFTTELDRRFNAVKYRFLDEDVLNNTFWNKYFTWTRSYDVQWDLFKALKIKYFADFEGVVDEPDEKKMISRSRLSPADPNYIADVDQYRRDSLYSNFGNLGRPQDFTQNIDINFKVPFKNFPLLDFVDATLNYNATYRWEGSSIDPFTAALGNVISNEQKRSARVKLKFDKLYKKSKYLGKIDKKPRPSRPGRGNTRKPPTRKDSKDDKDKEKKNREPSKIERALIRPFLLVRSLDVDYRQTFRTVVPGYMPSTELFGLEDFSRPGWDFVFGLQPNIRQEDYYTDKDWLYQNYQWISTDVGLNKDVVQEESEDFKARLELEPFRDFKITINADKSFTQNHIEGFARLEDNEEVLQSDFVHAVPRDWGSFKISYFAMNTLFENDIDQMFLDFFDNQRIIANRLNPGAGAHLDTLSRDEGFPYGYGVYHESTLLPAFLATYTGKDANTVALSEDYTRTLFDILPKLNWRVQYDGLSKLPFFKDIFKRFSLAHGYQSTLTVNRFETNTNSLQTETLVFDGLDKIKLDYVSRFNVPDIVIDEAFSPLIGLRMELQNGMSLNFETKKSRNLAFEVYTPSLLERRAEDWTIGFGYTMKEVTFDFLSKKKKKRSTKEDTKQDPKNQQPGRGGRGGRSSQGEPGDLNINFDFSLRDDITQLHRREFAGDAEPARGSRTLSISPSAEYRLNKQLLLRVFFDYNRTEPKTSQSFPRTDIQTGITVSFQLN